MAKSKQRVAVAECPECGTNIRFHKSLRIGQLIICPECDERLQVYEVDPLGLEWADEDYEDDSEEWD